MVNGVSLLPVSGTQMMGWMHGLARSYGLRHARAEADFVRPAEETLLRFGDTMILHRLETASRRPMDLARMIGGLERGTYSKLWAGRIGIDPTLTYDLAHGLVESSCPLRGQAAGYEENGRGQTNGASIGWVQSIIESGLSAFLAENPEPCIEGLPSNAALLREYDELFQLDAYWRAQGVLKDVFYRRLHAEKEGRIQKILAALEVHAQPQGEAAAV